MGSCPPLPWPLPAPSLRRGWRPLRLFPMSMTPPAMSLSTIPLQLFPTSTMPLVMLPTLLPLKPRLTSMTPQVMLLFPTATLDTPMPLLPTTPAVSTTLAALCPAHKFLASKLKPKDRRRTAKDRGRLENENWILEDVV